MLMKKLYKLRNTMIKYKFMAKPIFLISLIYIIGISAIIRTNFNYIDDIGRVAHGYKQWNRASRYISTFLSSFIHADHYLTDVSPLTQFIAVLILATSGVIILYIISHKETYSALEVCSLIPLGLSPYFLECISYKYDAPYMALSILAAIFPLLFYKYGYFIYSIASMLGILVVCTTYQPATGIFPMLVILLCLEHWNNKDNTKKILIFIITSVTGYLSGLIIFKLFIMQSTDSYVPHSLPAIRNMIPTYIANLKKYTILIKTDFKKEWLICIFLMCLLFVFTITHTSKQKKYIACPLSVVALLIMFVLSFGIYPFLLKPLFAPRAMYGFGIFITFIGVHIVTREKNVLAKLLVFVLGWYFFVFAFTYGNALEVQKEYTDFRTNLVVEDLKHLDVLRTDEKKKIQIEGSIGFSPIIKNMPQDYQMLNRLIPITFCENWYWGSYELCNYYGFINVVSDSSTDLTAYDLPILEDNIYHTIRGKNNYILVELK